jgi:hypothetical protein
MVIKEPRNALVFPIPCSLAKQTIPFAMICSSRLTR